MNRQERYSKENFEKAIKSARSIKGALKNLDLRAAGGNYKVFHKYVKMHCIDTSHFETRDEIYKRSLGANALRRKKPLSEILIEDSTYGRTHLKKRLYEEGLKEKKCEMSGCGQGEIWMGKKMSLIIDHINGVYNDNRLENLRIVCANCNATLPTHCGKHNAKPKQKKDPSIREKSDFKKRIVKRPPFAQLKQEIDELGYSATGRKYGVSDNAIRKWLKSYEK